MKYNFYSIQSILTFSFFVCLIYAYYTPIDFHCDSATFYNAGSKIHFILKKYFYLLIPIPIISLILIKNLDLFKKKYFYFIIILILFLLSFLIFNYKDTPFKINTFNRPPLYPLFMIFSGLYTFNTFIYFITLQIFISLVCIYMIYKILNKFIYNSKFVFFSVFIYALTSIPYVLITYLSAEQLSYLFMIAFIYFVVEFHFSNKSIYLYFALIASLCSWFTRWEGQIIFISFCILTLIYFFYKKISLKKILIFILISFISIFSWTTIRSISTGDFSSFFSVSNSSMDQLMWKYYSSATSTIYKYEKKFNLVKKNSGVFKSDLYPNQPIGSLIVHPDNGPNSKYMYDLISEIINEKPDSYKYLKQPLADVTKDESNKSIDFYYQLFGKFDNNELILKNIFEQPSIYYFNYFNPLIIEKIGRSEKDQLYKKVIFEAFNNYPIILFTPITFFFEGYGIDLENYLINNGKLFGIKDLDFLMTFNGAKCASNNLTTELFDQYKRSHNRDVPIFVKNIFNYSDFLNDFIRSYFGLILIVGYLIILFINPIMFIPLCFIPISYTAAVSFLVGAPINAKYEVLIFPINFMILSITIYKIFFYLLRNIKR